MSYRTDPRFESNYESMIDRTLPYHQHRFTTDSRFCYICDAFRVQKQFNECSEPIKNKIKALMRIDKS